VGTGDARGIRRAPRVGREPFREGRISSGEPKATRQALSSRVPRAADAQIAAVAGSEKETEQETEQGTALLAPEIDPVACAAVRRVMRR
jgi:hypothetical protein